MAVVAVVTTAVVTMARFVIDAGARIAVDRIGLDIGRRRRPVVARGRISRNHGAGAQTAQQGGGEAEAKYSLLEVHGGMFPGLRKQITREHPARHTVTPGCFVTIL
jgi:hypothetical protein